MNKLYVLPLILAYAALGSGDAVAARISDVRGTLHNLSADTFPSRTVKAVSSKFGVCVFCHTAHTNTVSAPPLWNKEFPIETYVTYSSSSLDALDIQSITELDQPDDSSKMCLSCHDGTLAIGAVAVLNGQPNQLIRLSGTSTFPVTGAMPAGAGEATGYTRRLGVDLRNDHPISVSYTSDLALRDGELRDVDANQKSVFDNGVTIGPRADGGKHVLPLFGAVGAAQLQCPTCHDPHLRDDNLAVGNQKFLRMNRFQEEQPTELFSQTNDIICLACHDKGGASWAFSAHANKNVATQLYKSGSGSPSELREFPADLPVWKASCHNCHDTHTVEGARRLLREGTDSLVVPKSGGASASEETCFQCHNTATANIIVNTEIDVPDIKTDYGPDNFRMPIATAEQAASVASLTEVHDIGGQFDDTAEIPEGGVNCILDNKCGADFVEKRSNLGAILVGNLVNRHAECSDCHNPHRVVRFKDFRGFEGSGSLLGTPDASGTHRHNEPGYRHTNIASGVLRGTYGVEPEFSLLQASFHDMPTAFTVKRGDPGINTIVDPISAAPYVTREYQICLKCHSNYGYADNNQYPTGNRPNLTNTPDGGTPSGTNLLTQFTNQAKEFQAPDSHKGAVSTTDSGASAAYSTNNHRSWHPVMSNTGRMPAARGGASRDLWLSPWNGADDSVVGNQTMYCSDCHGSATNLSTVEPHGVVGTGGAWGPHGSSNTFLLKGQWNQSVGSSSEDALCFRCHDYNQYANPSSTTIVKSGFSCSGVCTTVAPNANSNLHAQHAAKMISPALSCSQCHESVSHGWKNKALLVNLNDVGPEAGLPVGTSVTAPYGTMIAPQAYYMGAQLRISAASGFAKSGEWTASNCAGSCHHLN